MKRLKHYLPEGFGSQMPEPTQSDSIGPVSGALANSQPDPAETVNGHRELNVGDPVIISGKVRFSGCTGEVDDFGQDKKFVVVNLYTHGRHSFHSSDVAYNDYDDEEDDDEDSDDRELRNLRRLSGQSE